MPHALFARTPVTSGPAAAKGIHLSLARLAALTVFLIPGLAETAVNAAGVAPTMDFTGHWAGYPSIWVHFLVNADKFQ